MPYSHFLRPIAFTHSSIKRAYWRVLMSDVIDHAWKEIVGDRAAATLQPRKQRCTNIRGQFKLDRATGLLLDDYYPVANVGPSYDVANLNLDQVAAAWLDVDSMIEQRFISQSALSIEVEADCPNLFLRRANGLARIPCCRAWMAESNLK